MITRNFKETIQARALTDRKFREGLLRESIESMLAGDLRTGKILIRDYINATVGFEKLSKLTHKDSKSLMRMFSISGNPTAHNLFDVIHVLQEKEGVFYALEAKSIARTISRHVERRSSSAQQEKRQRDRMKAVWKYSDCS